MALEIGHFKKAFGKRHGLNEYLKKAFERGTGKWAL
jgi:hypothetical protein